MGHVRAPPLAKPPSRSQHVTPLPACAVRSELPAARPQSRVCSCIRAPSQVLRHLALEASPRVALRLPLRPSVALISCAPLLLLSKETVPGQQVSRRWGSHLRSVFDFRTVLHDFLRFFPKYFGITLIRRDSTTKTILFFSVAILLIVLISVIFQSPLPP
ncbi:uncharacterized protein IWZ02DRAFT_313857 [Phyllosticta citriasiana]|uniref:uncharacterized protein n=1 Tax=Phyllosticta citriasiana TaxID=595635 RepID=UPI0030FD98BF